jgi:hypothetical protein
MSNKVVVGMAHTASQADVIVRDLGAGGFSDADISVLLPDRNARGPRSRGQRRRRRARRRRRRWRPDRRRDRAPRGIGSLSMPGLGVFIAAGPILAALGGAGAGAAVGGITGALVGAGIPEYEAKFYEGKLRSGNILIAVHTEDSEERTVAKEIFERAQATDISSTSEASVSA